MRHVPSTLLLCLCVSACALVAFAAGPFDEDLADPDVAFARMDAALEELAGTCTTVKGKACKGKCAKNGHHTPWCYYKGSYWDTCKCTSAAKVCKTKGITCKSKCAKNGHHTPWCYYKGKYWGHCSCSAGGYVGRQAPGAAPPAAAPPARATSGDSAKAGWGLSAAEVAQVLELTNKYRARHGAKPMVWENKVADNAYRLFKWKSFQNWDHSSNNARTMGGKIGFCGENLAASSAAYTIKPAVDSWYNERKSCRNKCCTSSSGVVGHFTALVWKSCQYLGCARSTNGQVIVCQYCGCESPTGWGNKNGPNFNWRSGCSKKTEYGANVQK
jgi:hypothetical protein